MANGLSERRDSKVYMPNLVLVLQNVKLFYQLAPLMFLGLKIAYFSSFQGFNRIWTKVKKWTLYKSPMFGDFVPVLVTTLLNKKPMASDWDWTV